MGFGACSIQILNRREAGSKSSLIPNTPSLRRPRPSLPCRPPQCGQQSCGVMIVHVRGGGQCVSLLCNLHRHSIHTQIDKLYHCRYLFWMLSLNILLSISKFHVTLLHLCEFSSNSSIASQLFNRSSPLSVSSIPLSQPLLPFMLVDERGQREEREWRQWIT